MARASMMRFTLQWTPVVTAAATGLAVAIVGPSVGRGAEPAASRPAEGSAAAAAPSVAAVRQLVDAGKYREALAAVAKELGTARRGTEASPDRHVLLSLKGESLLRLGGSEPAAAAFEQAAAAAAVLTPPDVNAAAAAHGNALLARRSPRHLFHPPGGGSPIDVADPAARAPAFTALHDEQAKALAPKVAAARQATSLEPMSELLPAVADLAALEIAATGAAPAAKQALTDLGGHALRLIADELRRIGYRVQQLDDVADSVVGFDGIGYLDTVSRRGLQTAERKELEQTIAYLRRIEQTARRARAAARQLGFAGDRWEPVVADAGDLIDRAQALHDLGK